MDRHPVSGRASFAEVAGHLNGWLWVAHGHTLAEGQSLEFLHLSPLARGTPRILRQGVVEKTPS